jgi:hypothetical protein
MSYRSLVSVVLSSLVLASAPAGAALLATAPVFRGGQIFCCNVVNIGGKEAEVLVGARDLAGAPPITDVTMTLAPGVGNFLCLADNVGPVQLYCQFDVLKGGKRSVRASACGLVNNGPCGAIEVAR